MPKTGTFYHPVDTWSSTVAEAEEHARFHAVDDRPDYDHSDYMDDEEEEDTCGCSDPGCPCDGAKRGGPP